MKRPVSIFDNSVFKVALLTIFINLIPYSSADAQDGANEETGSLKGSTEVKASDPLVTFRQVKFPMPKGMCLYEDMDQDVKNATGSALDKLKSMADSSKGDCKELLADADNVQENLMLYFDTIYGGDDYVKEGGEKYIEANCNNYDKVLQIEMGQFKKHAMLGVKIEEQNPFKGKCLTQDGRETFGDGNVPPEVDQCLKDILAGELKRYQKYCIEEEKSPMRNLVYDMFYRVKKQEEAAIELQRGMGKIFQSVLSGKCFESKDLAKSILQSAITIGSAVASTALGPAYGIGLGLGGQTINFTIEYINQLADKKVTVREILKDKNYENSVCMFVSLQKRYCEQLNVQPSIRVKKLSCSLRDKEAGMPILQLVDQFSKNSTNEDYEDAEGEGAMPAYYQDLKKLTETLSEKRVLPGNEEKMLQDVLTSAIDYYAGVSRKDMNRLLIVQDAIQEGTELMREYQALIAQSTSGADKVFEKFKTKRELLKRMGETLKKISNQDIGNIIENYLNRLALGQEGLEEILAEEMSVSIMESLNKKSSAYEGNMDSLRDVIDSAVEQFKPVFKERMDRRFYVNFQNAANAEKALINTIRRMPAGEVDSSFVMKKRHEVFAWLRDISKDCLSTQGVHVMKRDGPSFWQSLFGYPQLSALLNIDRTPDSYLQACKPFMCENGSGIPIPYLPDSQTASSDYQRYSCQLLERQEDIFKNLRDQYLKRGTICGKSIQQITSIYRPAMPRFIPQGYVEENFHAGAQDTDRLKNIITTGKARERKPIRPLRSMRSMRRRF